LEYRNLGRTGMRVSEISLGTWAFGGDWGTVEDNVAAAEMPPLSDEVMQRAREIYDGHVREEVHHRW
jgi:aryl-alcohol dehydrogenase-like predicted oxidoreductase